MSPTFSRGKSGKSYRYYVSTSLQQGSSADQHDKVQRLPAPAIERIIGEATSRWLTASDRQPNAVSRVRLTTDGVVIEVSGIDPVAVAARLSDGEKLIHSDRQTCAVFLPLALPLRGGKRGVAPGQNAHTNPDPVLIAALRRAHSIIQWERGLPVIQTSPSSRYDCNILRLAFLSPDIQRDILAGRQPRTLNLEAFKKLDVPIDWSRQCKALGYTT